MVDQCPLCGGKLVEDRERGELVCEQCGCVASRMPDQGPEWRAYSPGKAARRARAGAPLTFLLHDMGLSTIRSGEGALRPSALDKHLIHALSHIQGLSAKLGLPSAIAETAALIYRRAERAGLVGKRVEVAATASLYLASRLFGLPRHLKEFASASGLRGGAVSHSYRRLAEGLKLRATLAIQAHISKIVKALGLRGEVERAACKILEEARRIGLTQGKKPRAVAAASIYVAAKALDTRVNQRDLSRAASISPVTLRNRYKELAQKIDVKAILRADQVLNSEEA